MSGCLSSARKAEEAASAAPNAAVIARMAADPGAVIEDVAKECDVSQRTVVEALPPQCAALPTASISSAR